MFGGHHDRIHAKDRIDARGKHTDFLFEVFDGEINERTLAASHPIALAFQDLLRPAVFDLFDVLDQLLRIIGDAQKPLLDLFLDHRCAAAPTDASRRLLVR